eukprot:CAMPEP_0198256982 /NCGR_PEP_ID=MMETSP1447-20131203/6764_1 /TAXON_ID=420782 /ORGANISM="Chaetoceros dichaeta, Strain CCMP1751" /LENGTH=96 /DNA_ID=CAMNT_0043943759 /DNA_START=131 /DNA_END=421 /DNA_ORIENTATION=-
MRNPRRDAVEYGILLTLSTAMAGAMGLMLYLKKTPAQDGTSRRLQKIDLDAPVDFAGTWKELKKIKYGDKLAWDTFLGGNGASSDGGADNAGSNSS